MKAFKGVYIFIGVITVFVIYWITKKRNTVEPVRATSINGKTVTTSIIERDSLGIKETFNKIFNPTMVEGSTVDKSDLVKPPQVKSLTNLGMPESFNVAGFLQPFKNVISPEDQKTFDPPMQVKTLSNPVFENAKYVTPGKSSIIEVPKVIYPGRTIESRTVEATLVTPGGKKSQVTNFVRSK